LDLVIQASRIYKQEKNEDFERERDMFIDAILLRNDCTPLMLMDLSTEDRERSADALSKFLVTKVDAERLQLLKDGRVKLSELGIKHELIDALPISLSNKLLELSS
jgi:hypothetical protein